MDFMVKKAMAIEREACENPGKFELFQTKGKKWWITTTVKVENLENFLDLG